MTALGNPHLHLRRVESTNDRARALALAGAPHGTLVTASQQTLGRGRQGRSWSAPPGQALLMSVILRDPPTLLPLAAAVAVAHTVGGSARIKWPNDVLTPGGKVAGILAEGRPQAGWAVLGIGVNVAVKIADLAPELAASASSLGARPTDIEPFLDRLLGALSHWTAAGDGAIAEAWRERDALLGQPVRWAWGAGRAAGIDGAGRLVIELEGGGQTTLEAGEVHLIASAPSNPPTECSIRPPRDPP